jgi:nitroimidazol reductase NimA-like FMN-containing flavoprotein (pyridoxamine 5'-phosphate oxidase superfamily)
MNEVDKPVDQLEVLSEQQCLDLLASRDLGRVAFSIGEQPEIFPVNYATDRAIVVFRTAAGTKLDHALASRVAFEVDDWDEDERTGWSVVMKGVAQEVTSGTNPFEATLRTRNVWPLAPGEHDHWIAIYPSEITGRRFRRA